MLSQSPWRGRPSRLAVIPLPRSRRSVSRQYSMLRTQISMMPSGAEHLRMAADQCPGIAQVMQDVIVNDAIDAVRHRERQRVGLHVGCGYLLQMLGGGPAAAGVTAIPSRRALGFIR